MTAALELASEEPLELSERAAFDLLDQAETALAVVERPEDAEVLWRKVASLQDAARRFQLSRAVTTAMSRTKLRAERRWGELLGEATVGGTGANQHTRSSVSVADAAPGADREARRQARRLSKVPTDVFDAYVNSGRADTAAARELIRDDLYTRSGVFAAYAVHQRSEQTQPPGALPEGAYRAIVADPPWQYGNTVTRGAAEDHYPTMTIPELCELDIASRAADDAHLYLWVTNGFLREGFDVLDAWGFTYKTCLTWVKPQMGMGNYFRSSTEHVLFGVRGSLRTQDRALMNWFQVGRGRHSSKPDSFYDLVEKASPGPYLELFARRARFGWDYWGDQALETAVVE